MTSFLRKKLKRILMSTCFLLRNTASERNMAYIKVVHSFSIADKLKMFTTNDTSRATTNTAKLKRKHVNSAYTKFFYATAVEREYDKVPSSALHCHTINSFDSELTGTSYTSIIWNVLGTICYRFTCI